MLPPGLSRSRAGAVSEALGRGPRSLSRICGPSFGRRGLRPRSPDAYGPGLMRAAPSGEERRSPQYAVPVSPQCPQEIGLLTLPRTVFQGAAISSERTSQFLPPGNVAELGCSPPLRGSLEQLVRLSPAGVPFQGTELAARITPEASLERLVPLVDCLAAWKLLPNVSQWVLHTVERGYRIQFGSPPPRFNGMNPTLVGPEQALVMEREVETLLRKEAIEVVPPRERESGFYSRYFVVPKKDGGLRPILDLHQLNRSVSRLKFKMLTLKQVMSQIKSKDWFVTIDLKDAYFHISILPSHREFLRFAFGGKAYQYRVLPFDLALSSPHFYKVCGCCVSSVAATRHPHTQLHRRLVDSRSIRVDSGSTSRCCSRSHGSVGVKTECQEECAFSITENHLPWCGVGFNHDAGTFVPCSDQVDPRGSQESERRPVTHCQAVSEAAGSDGSCVQHDTYWPAVHETSTVVAQDQGVFPEGKPASHDQGHAAVPTCLRHVETTLVLVSGPGVGSSVSPRNASDGCIPHRLGRGHEWPPCPRSMEWSPSHLAHQLAGDAGGVSGSETLSPRPKRSPCVGAHRQQRWSLTSTTNEVCGRAPCTGWRTRFLCGPRANSSR